MPLVYTKDGDEASFAPSKSRKEGNFSVTDDSGEEVSQSGGACEDQHTVRPNPAHLKTPQTPKRQSSGQRFHDEGYYTGAACKAVLPITPSPTPKAKQKRTISSESDDDMELIDKPTKGTLFENKPRISTKPSSLFTNIPRFSVLHRPQPVQLAPVELKRAAESILEQVNWDEVAEYVASNRKAGAYKRAVKDILQAKVDESE